MPKRQMVFRRMIRPLFLKTQEQSSPYQALLNYTKVWQLVIGILVAVALIPLASLTAVDMRVTDQAMLSDNILRIARTTSNTRRVVGSFFKERKSALNMVVAVEDIKHLKNRFRLQKILDGLKQGFGGFVDLSLVDASGKQLAYVGPYLLGEHNYKAQAWFKQTLDKGEYISDVFLGFRGSPHLVVAVRVNDIDGQQYILRATLDTEKLILILKGLDLEGKGEAFLINNQGILQTPALDYGQQLELFELPVPTYSKHSEVLENIDQNGEKLFMGYAYIENTPFILMVIKHSQQMMQPLNSARKNILWIFIGSILVILLAICGVATYMVNTVYVADQNRIATLQKVEHTNRMASIGRLAAGVAHEINNPLAIINEKAGLIKDLFTFKAQYEADERLMKLVDSIISSVDRCGTITKRLLGFARLVNVRLEKLYLPQVVDEVLEFLAKESEYRGIKIDKYIADGFPEIESDRGKLQQIFLNLINNAFQAMSDNGSLELSFELIDQNQVKIKVSDDGVGISETDLQYIFEPFFSTKAKKGGTGLGLSITYGLVQELGGKMKVKSKQGVGSTFTLIFPLRRPIKENGESNENTVGR